MQTAAVTKIDLTKITNNEELNIAYMAGYADAMDRVRKRRKEARERRERKKYFAKQKLTGVATLIFTVIAVKALDGDITIAFLTIPLGLSLLLSHDMLITNNYFWEHEENKDL